MTRAARAGTTWPRGNLPNSDTATQTRRASGWPSCTVLDKNVGKKGTRAVATAYLDYLYTEEAQDLIGKHFYRPVSAKAQAKYAKQFPTLKLFSIDQAFGGWAQASKAHFVDGAMFDQIMVKK